MRSKELADFTGVTIRALRHYHALGILPEPPRGENGYRDYSAQDAVTILRIKRLSSMGFSLAQIKDMLSAESRPDQRGKHQAGSPGETPNDAPLKELETSLTKEIERLQNQRAMVRALLDHQAEPDVPPAYGGHISSLRKHGASPQLVEIEKAGILLLDGALANAPDLDRDVRTLLETIPAATGYDDYVRLSEKFLALPADASAAQQEELINSLTEWITPLVSTLDEANPSPKDLEDEPPIQMSAEMLSAFEAEALNEAQQAVIAHLVERFS